MLQVSHSGAHSKDNIFLEAIAEALIQFKLAEDATGAAGPSLPTVTAPIHPMLTSGPPREQAQMVNVFKAAVELAFQVRRRHS